MQPIERPKSESDPLLTDPHSNALSAAPRASKATAPVVETDEDDMASLMAASDQELHSPRRGELIEGIVVSMDRDGILVDVGSKSEGLIPPSEIEHLLPHQQPAIGDSIFVVVTQPEGRSEHAVLSLSRAREERGWAIVQARAEAGTSLNSLVLEGNRGGVV